MTYLQTCRAKGVCGFDKKRATRLRLGTISQADLASDLFTSGLCNGLAIMNESGRMSMQHWAGFDCSHLKDCLKDHPAMKLMDMVAERDAAVAVRDTAMAEKKTALVERDAAFLQREVAYADRTVALNERDAAYAVLAMMRVGKENNGQGIPMAATGHGKKQDGNKETQRITAAGQGSKDLTPQSKRKRKQKALQDVITASGKDGQEAIVGNVSDAMAPFFLSGAPPHPYCSCTGSNQQCYRWGKGGWQSACCTNFLSMYPLPMSTTKRNSRVPGRKMSGGAFSKLLERLVTEGVDISEPVDLRNYWAKHGTNRYITIK
ncbi:hypothetical protein GOP47_0028727 [Adiantum capillus-veneris]|nr:hypothetical protein GOP47_0028727 [Adiantum capillus-veneris]